MSEQPTENGRVRDNMNSLASRPLPKGSMIEYCGHEAMVLRDDGARIDVLCEDTCQRWWWKFEGIECTVISTPANRDIDGKFPPIQELSTK